jgi:cold shock CspA family protein
MQNLPLPNNKSNSQGTYFNRLGTSISNNFAPQTIGYLEDQELLKNNESTSQYGRKFLSDTELNPHKEFILFGDDGIQELYNNQNCQESESDDDSITDSFIKEGVLEDIESPDNQTRIYKLQVDRKFKNDDDGSVSSGSENQDEVNFEIADKGKVNRLLGHQQKKIDEAYQYSSDLTRYGNTIKVKESPSCNSSKIVPSTNFEPMFVHKDKRMSTNNFNEINYAQSTPQKMHINQQIPNPYIANSNSYPMNPNPHYAPNYHPMIPNQPGGYYIQPGGSMNGYSNMYPGHNMYPQQYMNNAGQMSNQMKSNSSSLPMQQNSLPAKDIGYNSMTSKMMPPDPNAFNQSYSMIHGAPGLMKYPVGMEPMMDKISKPKQMSSPLPMNNFNTFVPHNQQPPLDQNIMKMASANLPMQSSLIPEDPLNSTVPSRMTQSKTELKNSAKTNSSKKSKNKGKKGENRNRERLSGCLKFFDEAKNYGFLVVDQAEKDEKDMFVHYDDLKKTMIVKSLLSSSKNRYSIHFTFHVFGYNGKSKSSKKAVDIKLVSIHKIDPSDSSESAEPILLAKDLDASIDIDDTLLSNLSTNFN